MEQSVINITLIEDPRHNNVQASGIALGNIPLSMRKIVVPTDFSNNAMLAAIYAAGIAAEFGATIYVLHAMDAATDPILEPVALDTKFLENYTR